MLFQRHKSHVDQLFFKSIAAFPLQELFPGTRDSVCFDCRDQGLSEVPGKNFPLGKSLLER